MPRGRAQINGNGTAVAEKPAKAPKAKQQKLIETAIEGQETLVKLAEKREEVASERGKLGEELQQLDEALLAEMHKLNLTNWACKDERCQDCADAVMAQVFEDPASARPE